MDKLNLLVLACLLCTVSWGQLATCDSFTGYPTSTLSDDPTDEPHLPSCDNPKCDSESLNRNYFDLDNDAIAGYEGANRYKIVLRISEAGKIEKHKIYGDSPLVLAELERFVSTLPDFIPGTINGSPAIRPFIIWVMLPCEFDPKYLSPEARRRVTRAKIKSQKAANRNEKLEQRKNAIQRRAAVQRKIEENRKKQ